LSRLIFISANKKYSYVTVLAAEETRKTDFR